jgi:hypothetical protein
MTLKISSLIEVRYALNTNIFKWFDCIPRNKLIKNLTLISIFENQVLA